MSASPHTCFADSVPGSFWTLVEAARQDPTCFRTLLIPLNRSRLIRLYWTYQEVANQLRTPRHARHAAPDLSEDGLAELANWVVSQGAARYREILAHPERMPNRHDDAGFVSEMVDEYERRYGYGAALPINTHVWDLDWGAKGKASPWA